MHTNMEENKKKQSNFNEFFPNKSTGYEFRKRG